MSVRVRLPALFADRIAGVSQVDVSARTVDEALRALTARHPQLAALVFDREGAINPMLVLFLNDRQLAPGDQPAMVVCAGDELEIVPAIEGG